MADEKTTVTIRLTKEFHKKIKILAIERETTVKGLFVSCMQRMLDEEAAKKK
jgi:hypothetical protein